jgi:dihydroneopterin aldolase
LVSAEGLGRDGTRISVAPPRRYDGTDSLSRLDLGTVARPTNANVFIGQDTKMNIHRIEIAGLQTVARIGVDAKERKIPQRLIIDLFLEADLSSATASDHLSETVDYVTIAEIVEDIADAGPYSLIEFLANKICAEILTDSRIENVRVKVKKFPADLQGKVDHVAVEVTQSRT